MNEITEGANAISTYGLYAIVSALVVCVIYLYKRTMTLEKEFRDYIAQSNEKVSQLQKGLLTQTTEALNTSSKTLEETTEVLKRMLTTLGGHNA